MRLQVVIARAQLDVRGECATGVCYYSGIQLLSPSGILAATGIELGTPGLRGGRSTILLPLNSNFIIIIYRLFLDYS